MRQLILFISRYFAWGGSNPFQNGMPGKTILLSRIGLHGLTQSQTQIREKAAGRIKNCINSPSAWRKLCFFCDCKWSLCFLTAGGWFICSLQSGGSVRWKHCPGPSSGGTRRAPHEQARLREARHAALLEVIRMEEGAVRLGAWDGGGRGWVRITCDGADLSQMEMESVLSSPDTLSRWTKSCQQMHIPLRCHRRSILLTGRETCRQVTVMGGRHTISYHRICLKILPRLLGTLMEY